ncbi:MAG: isoleucine--tRNA ligase [Candidatus Eisenbacteria bacterium]
MKTAKPPQTIHFPEMEARVLRFWKEGKIFERSIEEKDPSATWSFYDGPPFATGLPHYGHLLPGTIKDVVPRYWAMRGKRIERRFGWDCHGLPVEFEMEKTLELNGRKEIEEYGVDRFNEACRGIVLRYTAEWREIVERLGRWVDFDNDYKTMTPEFMESVWAVFKKLWDKGLIYEDKKVLPYSTRITTPLSNFEANLNYQDVQDPSITVKMAVKGEPGRFLLIWTTTPWTLAANLAIAAHPDFQYVEIREKESGERYILLDKLLGSLYKKQGADAYEVLAHFKGSDLEGMEYEQLIPAFEGKLPEGAFRVRLAEFVTDDTGTGLVHIAPGFGEDDFTLGRAHGLDPLDHLDDEGVVTAAAPTLKGLYFKDADKEVIRDLKERGLLYKQETYAHSYPFCYRSDTPLIYRAISTWFVRVTEFKEELIANNQQIHWVPEHIRDGRFGKWLDNARDWAISRNRFWGNPIPIWRNEDTGEAICIGSRAELEELAGQAVPDIHKHYLDPIVIRSPKTGAELRRIPHVLDCWFESGSMPYAQQHYPFSVNDEEFAEIFPAEFIAEGLDQTRGWFYTLLVLSTALEKGPAFRNVVVNGIVLAEDGRKMSKRLKNYPDASEVFDQFGADTLRIYLLQSGAVRGEDLRFSPDGLKEMTRKVLIPFWNAYSFFATYASVDGWDPATDYTETRSHELDRWISIKLETLKQKTHEEMEQYHLSKTVPPLLEFIDYLTNWYIRRSRRRFWKSENDGDKREAYSTLYRVLVDLSKLAAPFIPFLAEEIYSKLRLGHALAACDSVHLESYPEARRLTQEELDLEYAMDLTRAVVDLGRELREKVKIKNRQPLARLYVGTVHPDDKDRLAPLLGIVQEEINVKTVEFHPFAEMAHWNVKPNFKLLGKELGPRMKEFQSAAQQLSDSQVFELLEGGSVELLEEPRSKDAFMIELQPNQAFDHPCHASGAIVVALDTDLSDELREEGLSRELINRVQRLRKDSGFDVDDRVRVTVAAPSELLGAFGRFQELIESETLSSLLLGNGAADADASEEKIDGSQVRIGVQKEG